MPKFRVYRPHDLDLVFDGVQLAEVSTRQDHDQTRWTEIRIYRTDSGKYVTENVGRSLEEGEGDRIDVRVLTDPYDIQKAFKRQRPNGEWLFIGGRRAVLDAFDQAIASDPSLRDVFVEQL